MLALKISIVVQMLEECASFLWIVQHCKTVWMEISPVTSKVMAFKAPAPIKSNIAVDNK
jgi:hypothetical protein